jgi:hypothetical protein
MYCLLTIMIASASGWPSHAGDVGAPNAPSKQYLLGGLSLHPETT